MIRSIRRSRSVRHGFEAFLALSTIIALLRPSAAAEPYDPYAEQQEPASPVAADGTLLWGTYYKSAAMQSSYERLWSLGACRGTNKAITIPVARNKLLIDNLPEESFTGRVRGAAGSLNGGLVAFTEGPSMDAAAAVLVAQLHPAGVTHLRIDGHVPLSTITPGMTVRLRTSVDDRGRGTDPVRIVEIVTPPDGFIPDAIRARVRETVVGTVLQSRPNMLLLKVDAGRLRRLALPLAADPEVVVVDATQLDLLAPGDGVEITGRRWSGEGSMASGTVFASRIIVHKASGQGESAAATTTAAASQ